MISVVKFAYVEKEGQANGAIAKEIASSAGLHDFAFSNLDLHTRKAKNREKIKITITVGTVEDI